MMRILLFLTINKALLLMSAVTSFGGSFISLADRIEALERDTMTTLIDKSTVSICSYRQIKCTGSPS